MRTTLCRLLVALVGVLGVTVDAQGQSDTLRVTLHDARRMVLTQSPAYLADAQVRDVAEGQLRQARLYAYNPEVELEAPTTISNGVNTYDAWLWQEVEWAGQRGLRIGAAEQGLSAAEGFVSDAARRALAEASMAFYAALSAQRRVAVAEGLFALNARLLEAVRTQVTEGDVSVMEANFAEIETGRARALVLATERQAMIAALELGRVMGFAPDVPVRAIEAEERLPAAATLAPDSLVQVGLSRRPDLAARVAEERQAESFTRLARRSAIPNLRLGAVLSQDPETGATSWGFGVGLPLPFWNRNQGLVSAGSALARQASLARSATELRIRTEVEQAVRAYAAAAEETQIFEADVLTPARQNQDLLETAYRAGRIGLTDLVLLRNQLLEAELRYWDVWLTLRAAWTDLQAATGSLSISESDQEDQ